MRKEDNPIDAFLHHRLQDAELSAEGIAWDDFETRRNEKRKRPVVWWFAVGVILLGTGAFLWQMNPNQVNSELKSDNGKWSVSASKAQSDVPNIQSQTQPEEAQVMTKSTAQAWLKEGYVDAKHESSAGEEANTKEPLPVEEKQLTRPEYSLYSMGIKSVATNGLTQALPELEQPWVYGMKPLKNLFSNGMYAQFKVNTGVVLPRLTVGNLGRTFIHKDYESIRRSSEMGIAGYGLQGGLTKSAGKWLISAGIGINVLEIKGKYNFAYSEKPIIDVDGRIINYALSTPVQIVFESKQKIRFMEIPLSLQYLILDKPRKAASIQVSWIPQFLNQMSGEAPNSLLLDKREVFANANYKSQTSVLELGMPLYKKMGESTMLSIIPYYRYNFGLSQSLNLYKTRLSNWGLQGSYLIKF